MASWDWCREHVLVEEWYHYWRIVTLHQIALRFQEEQERRSRRATRTSSENLLPLVDRQAHHPRVRTLSLGINIDEPIIKPPITVDWERYLPQIAEMGLKLPGGRSSAGRLSRSRRIGTAAGSIDVRRLRGLSTAVAHLACSGFKRGTIGSLPYSISRAKGAGLIGPVEDRLKVERYVGIARQERNGDLGEPLGIAIG